VSLSEERCALGVSAVSFCSKVTYEKSPKKSHGGLDMADEVVYTLLECSNVGTFRQA
jgi:hypothetical protein